MNKVDEQRFGLYVFLGFAIGAILGTVVGIANGNIFTGVWGGGLAGVFLGWFIAAAVLNNSKRKKERK